MEHPGTKLMWKAEEIFTTFSANYLLAWIEKNKPSKDRQLRILNACRERRELVGNFLGKEDIKEVILSTK